MSKSNFEWDEAKNIENRRKHGVSFNEAQFAFMDEKRVIAKGLAHSQKEERYYCFGLNQDKTGILTVRFTYRTGCIRIFGAGYWRKGKKLMSKQILYSDEPIGEFKLVTDFLLSPSELALKNKNTKITISLSSESLSYFKDVAEKHHMQYQKIMALCEIQWVVEF